jgi:hypothetical protein
MVIERGGRWVRNGKKVLIDFLLSTYPLIRALKC